MDKILASKEKTHNLIVTLEALLLWEEEPKALKTHLPLIKSIASSLRPEKLSTQAIYILTACLEAMEVPGSHPFFIEVKEFARKA